VALLSAWPLDSFIHTLVRCFPSPPLVVDVSPEWAATAYAASGLGVPFVPMYEQQHPSEWAHIVGDSGATIVLVSRKDLEAKVPSPRSAR
jgi:long-subunit acyl-CoA synthetase (AMP-forming)